ncbi:MAG TPA: Na+/H+ antiporter NhaA, partial [bacterium]|nr:Na+/H+ antiporter NhaA [bacterium]
LVGLEIKREIVSGELSSLRRASLPLFGAVGGMLVPALIYVSFNQGTIYENGWGVPMATDIAFALAILGLLGSRIPVSIKVFLTALAIIDDLGAIIVIALFYSSTLFLNYKAAALVTVLVLILINRLGIRSLAIYLGLGILLWYFVLKSGIHATIAGVILAMTIPYSKDETSSPLLALEHALHKPVQFFIMPIFALANTLIVMDASVWAALFSTLSIGIFTGLFFGKVCGILMFCWIGTKLNLAALPDGVTWHHLIGTGFLAGIGFTMSIFIAVLAFENQEGIQTTAKAAILTASIVSGLTGFMILRRTIKT